MARPSGAEKSCGFCAAQPQRVEDMSDSEIFPDLCLEPPLRLVSDTAALRTDRRATNVIAPHLGRARIR